jgi:general stress protein 26
MLARGRYASLPGAAHCPRITEMHRAFSRLIFLLASVLAAACASAPARSPVTMDRATAARDLMTRVRYCALITNGEDGHAQARTIDPSAPDHRFAVTFATNRATRKVSQLTRDPRVTLYYFDPSSPGYVVVIGTARVLETDDARQRWLEKWTPFYPSGADSALVYEVLPGRIEIVEVARGIVGDESTWLPPALELREP